MKVEPIIYMPTCAEVESLKVGDQALDCFGKLALVTEIKYRGVDVNGKAFVGYTTRLSDNATVTMSMKEDEICRTVALCYRYNADEIREIERKMRNERHSTRYYLLHRTSSHFGWRRVPCRPHGENRPFDAQGHLYETSRERAENMLKEVSRANGGDYSIEQVRR